MRSLVLVLLLASLLTAQRAAAEDLPKADHVMIEKTKHTLTLFRDGTVLKTYSVSIGKGGLAPKEVQGDNRTPEGIYRIDGRNAMSEYYKSLHISYPDPSDVRRAKERGGSPGGNIMIHGLKNGLGWIGRFHRLKDWTQGCIAVTNEEIDEIWRIVPDGTVVTITR